MRTAAAFAALAIVPFLAGCTQGDGGREPAVFDAFPGLPAANLTEGGFYSFDHAGGPLVFTLDGEGDAAFDLYDGQDRRLGSVGFTSETARTGLHRIDGVEAGSVVLRLQTLNGTLQVRSGDEPVARFQPLGRLVERVVLVSEAPEPLDNVGLGGLSLGGEPVSRELEVQLRRAPADLRILATGPWTNLSVEVRSPRGVVLRMDDSAGSASNFDAPGQDQVLGLVPSVLTPQNLRDGHLQVRVEASDLGGALVLEAESYSRAPRPSPPEARDLEPAFTYGELTTTPVAFTVHQGAGRLLLWQDGARPVGNASVALFDGRDVRVATVLVPRSGVVEVPVQRGGEYVAVLLGGSATLGADRAPADFELRPLEVERTVVPAARAGDGGQYAIASEEHEVPTAYAFEATALATTQGGPLDGSGGPALLPLGCQRGRFLRIDQAGEAVVVWHEPTQGASDAAPVAAGSLALGAGGLTVTHDGFGGEGCDRPAVAILSYVRAI